MKQYVTFTIDGVHIKAAKGTSVLDAAIEYGICIPHLCHVPNLSDIGACRLCIVEHVVNGLLYAECGRRHGDFKQYRMGQEASAEYCRVTSSTGSQFTSHPGYRSALWRERCSLPV